MGCNARKTNKQQTPAGTDTLGIDRVLTLSPTPRFIFRKGKLKLYKTLTKNDQEADPTDSLSRCILNIHLRFL
jgi:hypothetical protein